MSGFFGVLRPDGALSGSALFSCEHGRRRPRWRSISLRLSLSPTEEDWVEGAEYRRSWLWDAVRRPLRLLRKYGPDGEHPYCRAKVRSSEHLSASVSPKQRTRPAIHASRAVQGHSSRLYVRPLRNVCGCFCSERKAPR